VFKKEFPDTSSFAVGRPFMTPHVLLGKLFKNGAENRFAFDKGSRLVVLKGEV